MKKILTVLLIFALTLSLVACAGEPKEPADGGNAPDEAVGEEKDNSSKEEPKKDDKECETAEEAVGNMILGFNFGNTLDAVGNWPEGVEPKSVETSWGNPQINKDQIKAVKAAGFNAVRLPVTWRNHIDEKGNINEPWLDRVEEVVRWVLEEDLYCIVNVHHDTGADGWIRASENNYNEYGDIYAKIWEQVATRLKDCGEKLIFESLNETLDEQGNWGWPDADDTKGMLLYTQRFIDTVRSCGGYNETRNLVINTYAASAGGAISDFIMPEDTVEDHIIMEIHNYDPQGFCWLDASWTTMTDQWGSDSDKRAIDSFFEDTAKRIAEKGVPLIIGEFGSWDKNNEAERAEHAGYVVGKATEYGIKCFWWSCGEAQLIDRYAAGPVFESIIEAMVEATKQ